MFLLLILFQSTILIGLKINRAKVLLSEILEIIFHSGNYKNDK